MCAVGTPAAVNRSTTCSSTPQVTGLTKPSGGGGEYDALIFRIWATSVGSPGIQLPMTIRPPGFVTRTISAATANGSGANIAPKMVTTRSNESSGTPSRWLASPCSKRTFSRPSSAARRVPASTRFRAMSMTTTSAPRRAAGNAVVPSPPPRSRTCIPLVIPSSLTSSSPLSRMVAAIWVKSPFSHSSWFAFTRLPPAPSFADLHTVEHGPCASRGGGMASAGSAPCKDVGQTADVDFRVLGSVGIVDGTALLPLGGGMPRRLLAVLLAYRNSVVSTDRLVEVLWDEAPESAAATLQSYVSRLRRFVELDGGATLVNRAPGYVLEVSDAAVDAGRFEAGLAEARNLLDPDPAGALDRLDAALGEWRGDAFAEFA